MLFFVLSSAISSLSFSSHLNPKEKALYEARALS